MTMFQPISNGADRVMAALIAGLELEFGHHVAEGLAQRFIEAEECDFSWDARMEERWLGAYATLDQEEFELDRIAILGRQEGRWFVAICIVDGDEMPHGMMGRRFFPTRKSAQTAFALVG